MTRALGIAAVAAAVIAIFVPVNGILVSVLAVALAVGAALIGEYRYAAFTSAIVAANSFLFSPVLWLTVMWPAQLFIAAFVMFLVGLPLGAIAVSILLPRQRYAIALSLAWALAIPMAMNNSAEHAANEVFHAAERACRREHADPFRPEVSSLCYQRAKQAFEEAPRYPWGAYALAVFGPLVLGWLGYAAALWVRRRQQTAAQGESRSN